jgi:hypothetical protein
MCYFCCTVVQIVQNSKLGNGILHITFICTISELKPLSFSISFLHYIMTNIQEHVWAALHRAYSSLDETIYISLDEQHEFKKQTVLDDEFLTKDEKSEVIKMLNKDYDNYKILLNEGTKRICEN